MSITFDPPSCVTKLKAGNASFAILTSAATSLDNVSTPVTVASAFINTFFVVPPPANEMIFEFKNVILLVSMLLVCTEGALTADAITLLAVKELHKRFEVIDAFPFRARATLDFPIFSMEYIDMVLLDIDIYGAALHSLK